MASRNLAKAERRRGAKGEGRPLTEGDVAILRFLAAAEIIESDLWQQYKELALGNAAYQNALQQLDGDMPTYVNQNTRDEFSHQAFINGYLMSKGKHPVSLEEFRLPLGSQATGADKSAKRLTNLMNLTVDTSWYTRYRSQGNPDFGDMFPQIVNLTNVPTIPDSDLAVGSDVAQLIANAAGFHFATIEQGGSSLYDSFLPKVTHREVVRIVAAIGGTEIQHFEVWQDKAGNAPPVPMATGALFPQLPHAPAQMPNGIDGADPMDTNQIMARPCTFISKDLPLCSVIRPTLTANAGPEAAIKGFKDSGLFQDQTDGFLARLNELAEEAEEAEFEE
jgi:ferritin-like protein